MFNLKFVELISLDDGSAFLGLDFQVAPGNLVAYVTANQLLTSCTMVTLVRGTTTTAVLG